MTSRDYRFWPNRAAVIVVACMAGFAACASESDKEAQTQRTFIERLGRDTISVEVFTRTATAFRGHVLARLPVTRVARYEASLTRAGTIERMMVEWSTPRENPEGQPPVTYTVSVAGDSATIEVKGGRNPGRKRIAVPAGVIPTVGKIPLAFAVFEQATIQAAAGGADSFPVYFLSVGRAEVSPNAVKRVAGDTVSIDFFGSPMLARVDQGGRVSWRSGERTTMKAVGERIADLDLQALAADFAARDARGEGLGPASPRATVDGQVGEARIEIVYSRPAKRGREIWGGLVPYGEIWRTGANAATSFKTDRDLEIGGTLVPAGEYTLYSIFTAESAQLIINEQTGQWGTEYNRGADLARVELTPETLDEAVERFTISLGPANGGGALQLTWDRTRFSVPVGVR